MKSFGSKNSWLEYIEKSMWETYPYFLLHNISWDRYEVHQSLDSALKEYEGNSRKWRGITLCFVYQRSVKYVKRCKLAATQTNNFPEGYSVPTSPAIYLVDESVYLWHSVALYKKVRLAIENGNIIWRNE